MVIEQNDPNMEIALNMGISSRPDSDALIELLNEEIATSERPEGALAKAAACMDVLERRLNEAKGYLAMAREAVKVEEGAHQSVRLWLYTQMKERQFQTVKSADVTVYVKKSSPELVVTDEERIPEDYWKTKRTVDVTKLKAWIKANGPLEFAHLEQSEHVAIRRGAAEE